MTKEFLKFYDKKISSSINLKKKLKDKIFKNKIKKSIEIIEKTIVNGGKIYLCGNGGSAADAQHLAAEFLIRLRPKVNRKPIAAISLALDTSTITACSNDPFCINEHQACFSCLMTPEICCNEAPQEKNTKLSRAYLAKITETTPFFDIEI